MITHSHNNHKMALYSSGHLLVAQWPCRLLVRLIFTERDIRVVSLLQLLTETRTDTPKKKHKTTTNCDEPNSLFMTKWCVIRAGLELFLVGLEWGKSNTMPEDVPFVFLLEMLEELYSEGSSEGQTKSRLVLWCSCVTKAKKSSGHKIKADHEACVWQLVMESWWEFGKVLNCGIKYPLEDYSSRTKK
jgi:hypothetical protein